MKSLFLLLLLSAGIYATWDDFIVPVITEHLPEELKLTNKDGVDIRITPIRRDEENIYFRKEKDSILYSYAIEELSFLSKCKVLLYPKSSEQGPWLDFPSGQSTEEIHLQAMYKEHKNYSERLKLLAIKSDGDVQKSQKPVIESEIRLLIRKMNQLTLKIEEFELRNPHLVGGTNKLDIIKLEPDESDSNSMEKILDLIKSLGN